jgi:hypothetical protein
MRVLRQVFFAAFVIAALGAAAAGDSDQAAAERALGPRWKELSRRAGMVFAGTVLSGRIQTARTDRPVPSIALRFRVDRAIAGVESGEILTIYEWTGAGPLHSPMRPGEHILLFLYPPSRLGLTSPIAGAEGQVRMDATGRYVAGQPPAAVLSMQNQGRPSAPPARGLASNAGASSAPVTIDQLERAIRSARGK